MPMSPILYQNANRDTILIDVPTSIIHAQGTEQRLQSSTARDEPFTVPEPGTDAARAKVLALAPQHLHDEKYVQLIRDALVVVKTEYQGPWCLPRWTEGTTSDDEHSSNKREVELGKCFQVVVKSDKHTPKLSCTVVQGQQIQSLGDWDGSFFNDGQEPVSLRIAPQCGRELINDGKTDSTADLNFILPSQSSFLLADCRCEDKFRNHVRWMSSEHDKRRTFELILLDPPWKNRSAKRRAAYKTSDVQTMIEDMDLARYLLPNGYVGIWVTNKSANRDLVLCKGGIFESLNVSLVEEWIWIKTTTKGDPITPLDGIWRKPYEVLLLGRAPQSRLQLAQPAEEISRRIIIGVPDLHSRKPCLKTLIEPLLPNEHQVLEIFARYLVQGWTSWGDEVLKYNYEGCYEGSRLWAT